MTAKKSLIIVIPYVIRSQKITIRKTDWPRVISCSANYYKRSYSEIAGSFVIYSETRRQITEMHKPPLIPLVRTQRSRERVYKVLSLSVSQLEKKERERERQNIYGRIAALGRQGLIGFSVSKSSVLSPPLTPLARKTSNEMQRVQRGTTRRGDHYSSRARFVNGFYLWHCKLYNQPPQGRRLI